MSTRMMPSLRLPGRNLPAVLGAALALCIGLGWTSPARAIVSTGTNGFNGIVINNYLGADRFYNNGYTGTRSVVTNVEAGTVWNGHETLTNVNTYLYSHDPIFNGTQLGQVDRHATWVGQTIAGRQAGNFPGDYQTGIAYGTTLWSGAIATQWFGSPYTGSFGWSNGKAFAYPYETAMQTGINGRKTDVVNSSWGGSGSPGNDVFTLATDGLVKQNGTIFTVSAGNSGPGPNTVGWPANGFNTISVGALGTQNGNPPYNDPSSFTSRSPSDVGTPSGTIAAARAAVDISAPGQDLTLAFYGGTTGGNTGGTNVPGNNLYSLGVAGTSFAAPTVAGGAALIVDAGYDKFGGGEAIDGRVVKAVLMNSADKTNGWDNGQHLVGGVVTTTQALDYAVGTGRMNLDEAYDQYLSGTTGGTSTDVLNLGWKLGTVAANAATQYDILPVLAGNTVFTATLTWWANRSYGGVLNDGTVVSSDNALSHLELQLWENTVGGPVLVADSNALYNTSQHFSFLLSETGSYFLKVLNLGIYQEWGGGGETEQFGLAWSSLVAVPEPSTLAVAVFAAPALVVLVRRSRRKAAA